MPGTVTDLIAFLNARLDEREHFAKIARLAQKHRQQMLREVEADRAILALLGRDVVDGRERDYDVTEALEQVVRIRATIWSDHADYDPAWRPAP